MPTIYRNFASGLTTNNPLGAGATTLNSLTLAALPTLTAGQTFWVTLDPEGVNGAPEIVQITAHTSGATSATIARGQQTTLARSHPSGTVWVSGATQTDMDELPFRKMTAKGDLLGATAANVVTRLGVGADGEVLTASAAAPTGWAWAAATVPDGTITTAKLANTAVTAAKIANNAVTTAKIQAGAVTATKIAPDPWTSVTPVITGATTNPNPGSTVIRESRYVQYGKTVIGSIYITIQGAGITNGSGAWEITLPVPSRTLNPFVLVGSGYCYDASTNTSYPVLPVIVNTDGNKVQMARTGVPGAVDQSGPAATSGGWATGDQIRLVLSYEAA